ncbi:MAG: tRNA uridine(34) hydroxylase [bacterium]
MSQFEILLYYKYTPVNRPHLFVDWHKELCKNLNLKGRILIASEGINGTVEGSSEMNVEYIKALTSQDAKGGQDKYGNTLNSDGTFCYGNFSDVVFKKSVGDGKAFPKMKVKLREEIVASKLGEEVNPAEYTATHLPAEELHKWFREGKKFKIIDMRNDYEYVVGHFKDSINPEMENFRDLPKVLPKIEDMKDEPVVTVCTGGVRCEKASAYIKKKGFKEVYQLDGGMATYMEKFPGKDFVGSLYVFDNRVVMNYDDKVKEGKEGQLHEVIGKCMKCNIASERYINCANDLCHLHFICCEGCVAEDGKSYCGRNCVEKNLVRVRGE